MPPVSILGTGAFLPERVLTNFDLEAMVQTTDEWIVTRTGIRERRIANDGESASTLALPACRKALEDAKTAPEEIDLLLVGTITPDCLFPSTACLLQHGLGLRAVGAVDLLAACSGFVYAMSMGANAIRAGAARKVLVVGTEVLSKIVNWKDRNTCVLFGDGAGAAVLGVGNGRAEILRCDLGSDGSKDDYAIQPSGGSRLPCTPEALEQNLNRIHLRGRELFKFATVKLCEAIEQTVAAGGFSMSDVTWLVPHQMNVRIMEAVAKRLEFPMSRMVVNIDRFGNTSAASIAIAFDEARREGRFQAGDLLCFVALGGGLAWGTALVRW